MMKHRINTSLGVLIFLLVPHAAIAEGVKPSLSSVKANIGERAKIESIVRDYLLQHPEVIRDAMVALEAREQQQAKADIGLDIARFTKDREDPQISTALDATYALASALSINGTPAFVIGQQLIPGGNVNRPSRTSLY